MKPYILAVLILTINHCIAQCELYDDAESGLLVCTNKLIVKTKAIPISININTENGSSYISTKGINLFAQSTTINASYPIDSLPFNFNVQTFNNKTFLINRNDAQDTLIFPKEIKIMGYTYFKAPPQSIYLATLSLISEKEVDDKNIKRNFSKCGDIVHKNNPHYYANDSIVSKSFDSTKNIGHITIQKSYNIGASGSHAGKFAWFIDFVIEEGSITLNFRRFVYVDNINRKEYSLEQLIRDPSMAKTYKQYSKQFELFDNFRCQLVEVFRQDISEIGGFIIKNAT